MVIDIKSFFKPFLSGDKCCLYLPCTKYGLKIYPTKIEFYDLSKSKEEKSFDLFFDIEGPFISFSVFLDIKRKRIFTIAETEKGFFKYYIFFGEKIRLKIKKSFLKNVFISYKNKNLSLKEKESLDIPIDVFEKKEYETIHFGVFKKQDIYQIRKRSDLKEYLPLWYLLGQTVPNIKDFDKGNAEFFRKIEKALLSRDKEKFVSLVNILFKVGFKDLFYPSIIDENYQNINYSNINFDKRDSSLLLLQKGYQIFSTLFYDFDKKRLSILKNMFGLFPCGKLKNINLSKALKMDMEWSKKIIKKVFIYSSKAQEIQLYLQPKIKSFRLRALPIKGNMSKIKNFHFNKIKKSEIFYKTKEQFPVLKMKENYIYFLDNFKK